MKIKSRKDKRHIRHRRVRRKVRGTTNVPRLSVFKSSKHIYAQIIDDLKGHTLIAASSLTPGIRAKAGQDEHEKLDIAKSVGKHLGELSLSQGIKKVCFDRGGFSYHGRIKALAEGARDAGLEF